MRACYLYSLNLAVLGAERLLSPLISSIQFLELDRDAVHTRATASDCDRGKGETHRSIAKIIASRQRRRNDVARSFPFVITDEIFSNDCGLPFEGRLTDVVLYLDSYRVCMTYMWKVNDSFVLRSARICLVEFLYVKSEAARDSSVRYSIRRKYFI